MMKAIRVAALAGVLAAAAWGLATYWPWHSSVPAPAAKPSSDPDADGPPFFADATAASGIDFAYRNGEEAGHLAILESLGGGAALIDYDGDGLLDVYLPGGGGYAGPDKKLIVGHPGKLYRNLGGLKFADVTAEAGLDKLAGGVPWFYTHGAAVGDFDRDGRPDLLVTGWGRVALFRNIDGRRFVDVTAGALLDGKLTWATSAAFADFDGDGWPDLYVCQYVDWSFANHPSCNYDGKTPDVCPPKNFSGLPHKVFRNNGDGTFADVSGTCGLAPGGPKSSKGLGVLVVDVDGDGKPDVYVCNDTVDNFLYLNRSEPGRIRFAEDGFLAGVARDGGGYANGSMGVDAGDPYGSGRPAIWVTNYENELHALYRNDGPQGGQVLFAFDSPGAGIAALGQKYVGWGTGFLDLDHHGREDLFIANGHAIRFPQTAERAQNPVLLRNRDGTFTDLSGRGGDYFRAKHVARGVALGDLDNDGRVDAVISHLNEPVAVLRNVAPGGNHWLGVELADKSSADFVGARVTLKAGGRTQTRFAKGGGSYASSGDRRMVFGLVGGDRIDELSVVWPDGTVQLFQGLQPDGYCRLTKGDPRPSRRTGR
jgi:hypothetical protein